MENGESEKKPNKQMKQNDEIMMKNKKEKKIQNKMT
jgi:hypothetical protein